MELRAESGSGGRRTVWVCTHCGRFYRDRLHHASEECFRRAVECFEATLRVLGGENRALQAQAVVPT